MTAAPRFAGAVLCGGASRRMGADKALLELDGRALARRVADALQQAGADPVVAIGGDARRLREWGLHVVPDDHPGEGPLGGVLTALGALAEAEAEVVVVLACDLLHPSPDAIRAVVDPLVPPTGGDGPSDAGPVPDVAVPVLDGRPQFHHAAWRTTAAPALRAQFDAGERSLRGAVAGLRVALVERVDPAALADADDPASVAAARRHPRG